MEQSDLDVLVPLYDRCVNSFDPVSIDTREARAKFDRLVSEHYEAQGPEGLPFHEFRRGVVMACRDWLRKNN